MNKYRVTYNGWETIIEADTESQARYNAWLEYTKITPTTIGSFIDYACVVKVEEDGVEE